MISRITYELVQDGNTLGTTGDPESLTIEVESQTGDIRDGVFLVLRTAGWSVDDPEELCALLYETLRTNPPLHPSDRSIQATAKEAAKKGHPSEDFMVLVEGRGRKPTPSELNEFEIWRRGYET